MDTSSKITLLAEGIARAGRLLCAEHPLPARIHNPGDLEIGDRGYGVQAGKTCFPDDRTGWNWLFGECSLMLASMENAPPLGRSACSMRHSCRRQHRRKRQCSSWAQIVSSHCGMQPDNTLQNFLDA